MTRQALRQTIQALEKHYSVTLVENRMNRLYLTEAGEQLRRQAERIVTELNRTEAVMEEYACGILRLRQSVRQWLREDEDQPVSMQK